MSAAPVTKKDARKLIMTKDEFIRSPQEFKAEKLAVDAMMLAEFKSTLTEEMRKTGFEMVKGEGNSRITFKLAKEFGFCWGVERSIELALSASQRFKGKKLHITNELIHNPGVNEMMIANGIAFIEKSAEGKRFDVVQPGDVVILPAFGATLEEMQLLDGRGVTTVDTTCPWVSKVWNVVDKHVKAGMTSVIHGKYAHEESIATASFCDDYIILKDIDEAEYVCQYILNPSTEGKEAFLSKFSNAISKGFDPDKHLKKIGLANQTTMYKKETTAIGKLFEKTMMMAFDPAEVKDRYAAFDTICDATQERQDAIMDMISEPGAKESLDMILVVGGWDSSNTAHLVEIPHHAGIPAYHINKAECIRADNTITYRDVDGEIKVKKDFLALDRPVVIGVTSGASTPDAYVQASLEQLILLKSICPQK
jgi:4-hydroxy-3-methylbut-2-enyl diphosphate reductase